MTEKEKLAKLKIGMTLYCTDNENEFSIGKLYLYEVCAGGVDITLDDEKGFKIDYKNQKIERAYGNDYFSLNDVFFSLDEMKERMDNHKKIDLEKRIIKAREELEGLDSSKNKLDGIDFSIVKK